MQLRYEVIVDIDPQAIGSGKPGDVVRDGIESNVKSVDYVVRHAAACFAKQAHRSGADADVNRSIISVDLACLRAPDSPS
jgi:hypothetical protein